MTVDYRLLLLVCGFAFIFAFIVFLLVPQGRDVRARQMDLRVLETRARVQPVENVSSDESEERLHVLTRDGLFASLAHIRMAASAFGIEVTAFGASAFEYLGMGVSQTTVRTSFAGSFGDAVDFVLYLAGGVYNVGYFSLVNAEGAGFDVWISIFHE